MPKLYIPNIGDKITLRKEWTLDLYRESRNETLLEFFNIEYKWDLREFPERVTLPKGLILSVDRVYIRNGGHSMREFASVTFRVVNPEVLRSGYKKKPRFWAKLACVNEIEFESTAPASKISSKVFASLLNHPQPT